MKKHPQITHPQITHPQITRIQLQNALVGKSICVILGNPCHLWMLFFYSLVAMSITIAVPGSRVSSTLPDAKTTMDRPKQLPPDLPPVSRSQYVPDASPVVIVAVTGVVSRFKATNPLSPRENAMALAPLSHQPVWGVPATTRRNPTMFLI